MGVHGSVHLFSRNRALHLNRNRAVWMHRYPITQITLSEIMCIHCNTFLVLQNKLIFHDVGVNVNKCV